MSEIFNRLISLFEAKEYRRTVMYLLMISLLFVPSLTYLLFFESEIFYELEFPKLIILIISSNLVFAFIVVLFGIYRESQFISLEKKHVDKLNVVLRELNNVQNERLELLSISLNQVSDLKNDLAILENEIGLFSTDENIKNLYLNISNQKSLLNELEEECEKMFVSVNQEKNTIKSSEEKVSSITERLNDFIPETALTSIFLEVYVFIVNIWLLSLFLPKSIMNSETGIVYILFIILFFFITHIKDILVFNHKNEDEYKVKYKLKILLVLLLSLLLIQKISYVFFTLSN